MTLALTPSLSPRRERPELLSRLAPLNLWQVSPLPALSPPCGERVAEGRERGGSWARGRVRSRLAISGTHRDREPWPPTSVGADYLRVRAMTSTATRFVRSRSKGKVKWRRPLSKAPRRVCGRRRI